MTVNHLAVRPHPARTEASAAERPFISVIVPVRNEGRFIADTLGQLLRQDYPADRFEVLVADGRSTDDTPAIVTALQAHCRNLRLLDNPRRWSSAGRNAAIRAARGDLVLLVDGHCDLDNPHYLADLADAFARSSADCVGRPQPLDVRGATPLQRAVAAARSSRLGHHPASHIYSDREGFVPPQSVAVAYRREVFDKVGYFDEDFDACEDVELNHRVARAGLRCFFSPRASVRYFPRPSLGGLFRQMVRYGRGRVRLLRKHPDTFSPAALVPAAFLAGLVAGPLLALWVPVLIWVYAGALTTYALAVLAFSLALSVGKRQPELLPLLPPVFLAVHLGAGVGAWQELLAGLPLPRGRRWAAAPTPAQETTAGPLPALPAAAPRRAA
jgi:succinoglycan biosynthesis protein ExoA